MEYFQGRENTYDRWDMTRVIIRKKDKYTKEITEHSAFISYVRVCVYVCMSSVIRPRNDVLTAFQSSQIYNYSYAGSVQGRGELIGSLNYNIRVYNNDIMIVQ